MQENQQAQSFTRQNSEQQRGAQAWQNIRAVKELDKSEKKTLEKEYRARARGLNAMIQINGLGQTLGFLKAKGKRDANNPSYLLLSHLSAWMRDPGHFYVTNRDAIKGRYDDLLEWVLDSKTSSDDYRRATTECLAFGVWLRRFAEAELEEPKGGEDMQ